MNDFTRQQTRYDIQPLPKLEVQQRLEREQRQRREALAAFYVEESKLTARLGRVFRGVGRTAVDAWKWWGR